MKTCIVDIGSNSVRFAMIADGKTLYKKLKTTRLAEGLSLFGTLKSEAISRTAKAVAYFKELAYKSGAESFKAFATAAVRSAENGLEFVAEVKKVCGVEVDVISGETEAALGLLGALSGKDGGIIDVGGASSEVTLQMGGKVLYAKSIDIGTVRLFDLAKRSLPRINQVIKEKVGLLNFTAPAIPIYAIGGTATTIAAVKHKLKTYDSSIVEGTAVTKEEALTLGEKLLSLPVEQVKKLDGMEPRRADIIGGGCLLLGRIMERLGIDKVTVTENDNIEGYYALYGGQS